MGVSNPSQTLLNLVSQSQKVWEMWDNFVRGWQPIYETKLWLIGDKNMWQLQVRKSHHFVMRRLRKQVNA